MVMTLEQAYEILHISRDASDEDIKKSYKKLALKTHPDKNPNDPEAHKTFLKISEAYKRITDPDSFKDEEDFQDADLSEEEMNAMFFSMFSDFFPNMSSDGQSYSMGLSPEMFVMMEMMMGDDDMHGEYFDEEDSDFDENDDLEDIMMNAMRGGKGFNGKSSNIFMFDDDQDEEIFSGEDLDEIAMMEYLLCGGQTNSLNKKQQKELNKIMSHLGVEDINIRSSKSKRKPLRQTKTDSSKSTNDIKSKGQTASETYNNSVKLPQNPFKNNSNKSNNDSSSKANVKSKVTKMVDSDDDITDDITEQVNPTSSKTKAKTIKTPDILKKSVYGNSSKVNNGDRKLSTSSKNNKK